MAHLHRNLGVSDMLWKGVYIVIFGLFRYCSRLFLARVFWHADTHRPPTSPSFNGAFPQKIGKGPPKSRSILVPSWGHVGRFVAGTVLQGQRWRNWGHIARSSTYGRYTSYVLLVASRDTLMVVHDFVSRDEERGVGRAASQVLWNNFGVLERPVWPGVKYSDSWCVDVLFTRVYIFPLQEEILVSSTQTNITAKDEKRIQHGGQVRVEKVLVCFSWKLCSFYLSKRDGNNAR